MTYSVKDALKTFSKLIDDKVVTVYREGKHWAIQWDNSNSRIYLLQPKKMLSQLGGMLVE